MQRMRRFIRRQVSYFLMGFVVAFVVYLFVRFDADAVILGLVIGAGGGLATAVGITLLERRFPDEPDVDDAKK